MVHHSKQIIHRVAGIDAIRILVFSTRRGCREEWCETQGGGRKAHTLRQLLSHPAGPLEPHQLHHQHRWQSEEGEGLRESDFAAWRWCLSAALRTHLVGWDKGMQTTEGMGMGKRIRHRETDTDIDRRSVTEIHRHKHGHVPCPQTAPSQRTC